MAGLFIARGKWSLGTLIEKKGAEGESEGRRLKEEAVAFLKERPELDRLEHEDPGTVLESLMFYWSR